jgi:hypothetical protein
MKKIIAFLFLMVGSLSIFATGNTPIHNGLVQDTLTFPNSTTLTLQSGSTTTFNSGSSVDFHLATIPNIVGSNWGWPRMGIDNNGTALFTVTGAYQGQFAVDKDGSMGWWNGSNWTGTVTPLFGFSMAPPGNTPAISESVERPDGGFSNLLQSTQIISTGSVFTNNVLSLGNFTPGAFCAISMRDVFSPDTNGYLAWGIVGNSTINDSTFSHNWYLASAGPLSGFVSTGLENTINEPNIAIGENSQPGLMSAQIEVRYKDPATRYTTATINGTTTMTVTGSTSGLSAITGGWVYGDGVALTTFTISGSTVTLGSAATKSESSTYCFSPSTPIPPRTVTLYGNSGTGSGYAPGPLGLQVKANGQVAIGSSGSSADPTYTGSSQFSTPSLAVGGFTFAPTANFAGALWSNPMTTLGDIVYESSTSAAARLAGNTTTTTEILAQTGTGSVSAAPVWSNPNTIKSLPRFGVDANGTALQANSGAYNGQLAVTQDGALGWWNGSNWTSSLLILGALKGVGDTSFFTNSSAGLVAQGTQASYSALNGSTGSFSGQLGVSTDGHVLMWNGSSWVGGLNFGGPLNNVTRAVDTYFSNVVCCGHLEGGTGGTFNNPTIAAGTGAGTSPTLTLDSHATDVSGTINVTTGTSPTGSNATVATITFFAGFGSAPHVVLSPHNAAAAALSGTSQVFGGGETTTAFTVISGSTALAASTAYQWNYHVIQ